MLKNNKHLLFINPWVHDFAAHDFWAKPYGLLRLAAILRREGFRVSYIDCLDRFHPEASVTNPDARFGRGAYLKTRISNPEGLEHIPRAYSRYGILKKWLLKDLRRLPRPDAVLMTGLMTYWYPGVRETINVVRNVFPAAPIFLGGVYATLCPDHARRHSGADRVVTGAAEGNIAELINGLAHELTGETIESNAIFRVDPENPDTWPYPAFDLQNTINYIPLLTTVGCPFSCAYCAARKLRPRMLRCSPGRVVDEIEFWHKTYGVRDFVFYDDALLVNAREHAMPIFEKVIQKNMNPRFHTPNALHIRDIDQGVADLMYKCGFKTLRLGLETASFDDRKNLDAKVTKSAFLSAVKHLKSAGFKHDQIGAYLLAGLPDQDTASILESIRFVKSAHITPVIAHYSPIPHTRLWEKAVAASPYDLAADPIFTNNAIMPCRPEGFSWELLTHLKEACRG